MNVTQITDIKNALLKKQFPTVVMWNRLEGRPRTHHFDRALKAEVRDALWMITKQWQMGEFTADDAGSPVFAKIHISSSHIDSYKAADNPEQPFQQNVPLEVKAEQKKIPFMRKGIAVSIDIRLQTGHYWLKLLKTKSLAYAAKYIEKYKFLLPANDKASDYIYAHKDVWQQYAAISGRSMDGYQLYQHLSIPGKTASEGIENADPQKTSLDDLGLKFVEWFQQMYYQPLDEKNNAWLPGKLEYQFECSASAGEEEKELKAEEYYHGHLDWYSFDIEKKYGDAVEQMKDKHTSTFIPSHVEFDGMPNTRWWKFEDGKTNLGDIKPSTTDLSKLLLMEFGLVFSNDWFIVPYALPTGSLANIEGLTVKNNFGELTWIAAAEDVERGDAWSMFKLKSTQQDNTLFLAPAAIKVYESEPLEEIVLIRDEISNMVWGIETAVPLVTGKADKGSEVALRTRQFHEKIILLQALKTETELFTNLVASIPNLAIGPDAGKSDIEKKIFGLIKNLPDVNIIITEMSGNTAALQADLNKITEKLIKPNPDLKDIQSQFINIKNNFFNSIRLTLVEVFQNIADRTEYDSTLAYLDLQKNKTYAAPISYLAMTEVPENWIPFIPVHIKNNTRSIQLQRASMLRIIEGDASLKPEKVKPLTSILREGLEEIPKPLGYTIHEEEVPRSGVKISQSFQRTRWTSGEVYVWLGMKKKTGRGEGSSGLAFDQIKTNGVV